MKAVYWLVTTATLLSTNVHAQDRKTRVGILAGVNRQMVTYVFTRVRNNYDPEIDLKTLFRSGIVATFRIVGKFYVQPALLYTNKGAQFSGMEYHRQVRISWLEMPVHVLFKPGAGPNRPFFGFGPYIAYGISGKIKGTSVVREKVKWDEMSATEYYEGFGSKRWDAGTDLVAGFEFNKVFVQVHAQLGWVNIYPDLGPEPRYQNEMRNLGFGLSLGYQF